jgi:hypothetical protein
MNQSRRGSLSGLFVITLLALPACRDKQESPAASPTLLAGIPVMPQSSPLATAAGTDAVESAFSVIAPVDSVAAWYRRTLAGNGWQMTGDVRSPSGGVTIHAQKAARPIWVLIEPVRRGIGSTYSIIGAQPDTAVARGAHD